MWKLYAILAGFVVIILDQVLKLSTETYTLNTGAFLGLKLPLVLLVIIHLSIVAGGCLLFWTRQNRFGHWHLLLLIASLSNLIDRVRLGAVVDYIKFTSIWFNLSDAIITVVLVVLILKYVKEMYYARIYSSRK